MMVVIVVMMVRNGNDGDGSVDGGGGDNGGEWMIMQVLHVGCDGDGMVVILMMDHSSGSGQWW